MEKGRVHRKAPRGGGSLGLTQPAKLHFPCCSGMLFVFSLALWHSKPQVNQITPMLAAQAQYTATPVRKGRGGEGEGPLAHPTCKTPPHLPTKHATRVQSSTVAQQAALHWITCLLAAHI